MKIGTIEGNGSTTAALITDESAVPVRDLPGREDAFDALQLVVRPLTGEEFSDLSSRTGVPLDDVTFAAPILKPPKNVLCVGKNYIEHVREGARAVGSSDMSAPKAPVWFTKPATALVGSGGSIVLDPSFTSALDYEGELAIVIGREGMGIQPDDVREYIFGYTILNDITARDVQQAHLQWFRGKSADTYAPCGPWIVTADELGDPEDLTLTTRVNGEVRQQDSTKNLLFDIDTLVSNISEGMTLQPGDIIATGTPSGVAWGMDVPVFLQGGDVVTVEVERIGVLRNSVVAL